MQKEKHTNFTDALKFLLVTVITSKEKGAIYTYKNSITVIGTKLN